MLKKEIIMVFYSTEKSIVPHMMFIGRWCPLHAGHTWLIEEKMKQNPDTPILILVRDTEYDEFSAEDRAELVVKWMKHSKIRGTVDIISDITGVYFGRGVGYEVEEYTPPEDIKVISATKIREMIKNKDDGWKNIVAPGTQELLETII